MKTPIGFIYLWRDSLRNMYYVGSHVGSPTDSYLSSSRWLNSEIRYRPADFKRRILSFIYDKSELRIKEYELINTIKDHEFGTRYYNLKGGRLKGCTPPNKGIPMSDEQKAKISKANQGKPAYNKGKPNPNAADNGRAGAEKLSKTVTGRRLATREDGSRYWVYPE
jgi:hypothetical protein